MEEDRAAAPIHPRPDVVLEDADDVVEAIVAPHPFAAPPVGQTHRPVKIAVAGIVAPRAVAPQRQSTKVPPGAKARIRPEVEPKNRKAPSRRLAIALELAAANAGAPDGTGDLRCAGNKPAARLLAWRKPRRRDDAQARKPARNLSKFAWRRFTHFDPLLVLA